MSKIKLIIFDLSGIFSSNEEPPFVERFARERNLPVEIFLNRYLELALKSEVNAMSGAELWEILLKEFEVSGNPKEIITEMILEKESYPEMLEVAGSFKQNYTVVFLTNYCKDYWDLVKQQIDFPRWFSWGVVSYEIGFRKPAKEGFLYIMKKANATSDETVFVDDTLRNVESARTVGIEAIQFHNKDQLLSDFQKLGITS